MRLPILYHLPIPTASSRPALPGAGATEARFLSARPGQISLLTFAYEAVEAGGAKTIALNAADEVA